MNRSVAPDLTPHLPPKPPAPNDGTAASPSRVVARFEIPYRACLDVEGRCIGPLPSFVADAESLRRMYRTMVRARTFDAKAVNLQRTGKLGTYPSCLGQEAIHVGVGAAMRADDVL